jgi:replicative DNA helicase
MMMNKPNQADLLAEQRLLQTLFHQPEFIHQITDDLFSTKSNQNIFKSIVDLRENNIPITRDALFQNYLTRDIDGSSTVIDIISKSQNASLESIVDIVLQLKDFKKRREASLIIENALKELNALPKLSEDEVVNIKDALIKAEIALSSSDSNKKILNMSEWFDSYEPELKSRMDGKKYFFHNFIFDNLLLDGPRPGEIGLIVSSSGSGKSTLSLNLISDLIDSQTPCMYFSLEMSSIATLDRLISKRLGIPYAELVAPKEQNEFKGVIDAVEQEKIKLITNNKFRFCEDASISLPELYQHIKKFQADLGQTYCIVIIDLLSMITDFCKTSVSMPQQIEIGINRLSAMSKELGVHFIGVLQYNRGTESDAGKIRDKQDLQKFRPNRAQIKNSGAYLERARYVLSTFRQKMYADMFLEKDDTIDIPDIMEISVVKANNGQFKKIDAMFTGETFDITPIDDTTSEVADE